MCELREIIEVPQRLKRAFTAVLAPRSRGAAHCCRDPEPFAPLQEDAQQASRKRGKRGRRGDGGGAERSHVRTEVGAVCSRRNDIRGDAKQSF